MKNKIIRWFIVLTAISWLTAIGICCLILYIDAPMTFDEPIVTGAIFFTFLPILCLLLLAIITAGEGDESYTERYLQTIKCPECLMVCEAEVFREQPWFVYVHECEHCGYIITESDWEEVADEDINLHDGSC